MKRGKTGHQIPPQDDRISVVRQAETVHMGLLGNWSNWFVKYHHGRVLAHNPREINKKKQPKGR